MRTFLLPFTTFVFLFSSTVFGEEVKDVGLVCKRQNTEIPTHIAFWFKGGKKMEWYERDITDEDNDGDDVEYSFSEGGSKRASYTASDQYIKVSHKGDDGKIYSDWYEQIDRFTLQVAEHFMGVDTTADCKVYSSKDGFLSQIQKVEADLRAFLKKRKI